MSDSITFISSSRHPRTGQTEKVILSVQTTSLDEVLEAFERFLRGAGFYFKGNLDFIEDIDINKLPEDL